MAGVSTQHKSYVAMLPQWQRAQDTVAGQRAIHAGKEKYLPRLRHEEDDDYKARLARSDFFNGTWRTIAGLVGLAFRKEPVITLPAAIEGYQEDIDLAGTPLVGMAKNLCEEVLETGRVGIMVDYPAADNITAISMAAKAAIGLRPALRTYEAQSIINWRYTRRNNATILAMVTLKEEALIRTEDEFEDKWETRYRVLDFDEAGFYRQRVYKVEEGKDVLLEGPIYPVRAGVKMTEIPFRMVGASGLDNMVDDPPLIDLIDKNIAHYQVNSSYRHGAHYTALPTLFLAGIDGDESGTIYIGGSAAITARDPGARGEFIEYKGQGLGALENQLDRLERQMAMLGARMIADESAQAETLGATQIKRAGENSVMAAIVMGISEAIRWALGVMVEWEGASGEIEFEINRDFTPMGLDAQQLTAMVGAWQQGAMSDAELYAVLQRGDVIDGQKTFEEHQAELETTSALPRPEAA